MNKEKNLSIGAEMAVKAARQHADERQRPIHILFVCLGNICRSPAAHGIMESMAAADGRSHEVICDSAGFYGGHAGDLPDSRMRRAAFARGYRLEHRARRIREYDFEDFDLLIGMDDYNIRDLHNLAPTAEDEARIGSMADFAVNHPQDQCVPDPYYEGAAGFELVLNLLEDACSVLLNTLR
jgi:protein-tyrosine phosphatase